MSIEAMAPHTERAGVKSTPIGRMRLVPDFDETLDMLDRVESIAHILEASTGESEANGRLSLDARAALQEIGAFRMRAPRELGGQELSVAGQMVVLSRIAEIDSASAWCTMISNNGSGTIGAFFPQAAIDVIFADGVPRASGVAAPGGMAVSVDGGYRVSGTWRFGSNVHNAQWVLCSAIVEGDASGRAIAMAVPQEHVRILDNWQVTGLRGTGSSDFSMDDVFVPEDFTADGPIPSQQLRGERLYNKLEGLIAIYEHAGIAIGLARRALNLFRASLQSRRIGAPQRGGAAADREVIRTELSRLTLELDAAEQYALRVFGDLDATHPGEIDPEIAWQAKALTTYVTDLAVECAATAFRRGGGKALYAPNPLDRTLRDATAAQAHVLVGDQNYAAHGDSLIAHDSSKETTE